jgi:single-stranded DNA-binding protein
MTKNNKPYASFKLLSKGYRDLYIQVSCFGEVAEFAMNLTKGERIYVEGELQRNVFEKNGSKVANYSILANIIDLEDNVGFLEQQKRLNNVELEDI